MFCRGCEVLISDGAKPGTACCVPRMPSIRDVLLSNCQKHSNSYKTATGSFSAHCYVVSQDLSNPFWGGYGQIGCLLLNQFALNWALLLLKHLLAPYNLFVLIIFSVMFSNACRFGWALHQWGFCFPTFACCDSFIFSLVTFVKLGFIFME